MALDREDCGMEEQKSLRLVRPQSEEADEYRLAIRPEVVRIPWRGGGRRDGNHRGNVVPMPATFAAA